MSVAVTGHVQSLGEQYRLGPLDWVATGDADFAAGLTAPALAALTAARTDVDQTLSPDVPQDLADLEAAAESYGYGYHGQAPTRVLADLVTDFTTLNPLLTVPQPAPIRARLCRTAGQMAGMTAIV
ncbi:hypothetical protein ACFVJ4_43205 [Streptomyces sp. NPDC127178]|uniref:hypothetical protein n=1 Tax=unclassified Streptomyces TaxID=2593676 RepID=UPI003636337D